MYLKNLTLRGFKSFASATTLRLEPGITCVVGPNGSGKSNVVDALAWVMGEQGAKSLRGGKMEDVVFAGTTSRPPLGRAEVTLTIDNSDGALPIDYTEVTISRLMFRSGQSEYAINGDPCRLLDVQDLLSDSGLGREMHVIVGQGQLDEVLHAGPEARRALIEEAAGVLKHRKRKEKALRKLDAMQANLTRLVDLTTELRRQLKPLGRQAEMARKAAVIQADLRDARLRLLADDYVTLAADLARDEADEAAVLARRAALETELEQAQAAGDRAGQAAEQASAALGRGPGDLVRAVLPDRAAPRPPSTWPPSGTPCDRGDRRARAPGPRPRRARPPGRRAPRGRRRPERAAGRGPAGARRRRGRAHRGRGRSSPRPSGGWPRAPRPPPPGRAGWPGCASRSARPTAAARPREEEMDRLEVSAAEARERATLAQDRVRGRPGAVRGRGRGP